MLDLHVCVRGREKDFLFLFVCMYYVCVWLYAPTLVRIGLLAYYTWVVVQIMVPFWVLIMIRHLIFRVPKKGP